MAEEKVKIILEGEFKNKDAIVKALKNVDGKLEKISFQSKKSTKQVNGLGSSLKKLAAIVGVAFIAKKFFNLGKSVLIAAGNMEQFNIAFTTMLGSADKAADLLADIVEFARKTPFQIEGLVRTTKQLLAYGIAQDEIIPTLKNLGNIAAGVGVPVERLALVFGQVKSTTKLLGQDLNQFTQAGVPLLRQLAENLNITEAEVIKLKESGQISFDDVKAALRSMTAEGGRFFNLMEEQSKTFLGTLSNMEDGIQVVKIALGQALLPVAKKVANFMVSFFENLKKTVDENSKKITEFAENGLKGLVTLWKVGLLPILKTIGFFITGIKTLISQPLIKWLGLATTALLTLSGVMKIILATNPLLLAITLIVTAIGFLVQKFDTLPKGVQIALLKAVKFFQEFQRDLNIVLEAIFEKLSFLSKTPGFGWVDDAKNKFSSLKDSVAKDIDDISNKIKILEEGGSIQTAITMPTSAEAPPPITQEIKQEAIAAQEDESEKDKLNRVKALNEELLAEEEAFLTGKAVARGEADQLEIDNQLLQQQQKILSEGEFAEKRKELDEQFLEGKIEFQEFEKELDVLNSEAKLEALEVQFAAEQQKEQVNNGKLIESKTKLEKERSKQGKKRNVFEKLLDSEGVKNAGAAANELVQLQNSKHKSLAAIGKAAALVQIGISTAEGAIKANAALSGIPVVGPALGFAAAAALIAFGAEQTANVLSSFAVGTSSVPSDQTANIHKGEMIIPASFAESIRAGELALTGNTDTDTLASRIVEEQAPIALNINFDGAQFIGITDEMVEEIGLKLGELIEEDIIPAIPTRTAN